MRYFSTFSGIGGFELGIMAVDKDAEFVGYSEIDKYAIKVYERQFNGENSRMARKQERDSSTSGRQETVNSKRGSLSQVNGDMHDNINSTSTESNTNGRHKAYGDITKINADELPDFDCLVGGFPCQAFSIAGKRKGFDDTRGTLFFDLARILRAKQPRLFVFENVKGLLSHDNGQTFSTIISTLTELGYDCQWQVLNSKNHGVPQNRERVIIVGHLRGTSRPKVFPFEGNNGTATQVHPTIDANYYKGHSNQRRMIAQLNQPKHSNDRVYGEDGISPALNTMQGGMRQPFVAPVLTPDRPEKRQNGRRFKEDGEPSFTLTGQDRHGIYDGMSIRRLTPTECERLQGFPDGWTALGIGDEPISDSQRYKMCGNAVTVNVIQAVFERILLSGVKD